MRQPTKAHDEAVALLHAVYYSQQTLFGLKIYGEGHKATNELAVVLNDALVRARSIEKSYRGPTGSNPGQSMPTSRNAATKQSA